MNQLRSFFLYAIVLLCIHLTESCNSNPDQAKDKKTQDSVTSSSRLLGASIGIINTTLVVKNLDSARKYFTDVLGFKMPAPDTSQTPIYEGTSSSYIGFTDWSSLELLSVKDSGTVAKKDSFILSFAKQHEGVRMYTISVSSADTTAKWLQSRGFKTDTILSGRNKKKPAKGWEFDDGAAQWRNVSFNRKTSAPNLPDFMEYAGYPLYEIQEEWRPYVWRKYYDSLNNGVIGTSSLQIVVDDLETAKREFRKMGFQELESRDSVIRFKVAHDQELRLFTPKSSSDDAAKFLKSRGPGVFAVRFEVRNLQHTSEFFKKKLSPKALVMDSASKVLSVLKDYAFGVQLEFVEESKEKADLAKIYGYRDNAKLDSMSASHAAGMYLKYCSLCHGKNREGYAADNAPSLKSKELLATTQKPRSNYNYLVHTISYGRAGTAMAPYAKNQGGPLDADQIELIIKWLQDLSGVKKPVELAAKPVIGDIKLGKTVYDKNCASCHGTKGEGVNAPALANPMFLATASDAFLRYTVAEGRDSTRMPSFKNTLKKNELDAVTAFLRSRATGWNAPAATTVTEPLPAEYVLNKTNPAPKFVLKENLYVSAEQVLKALKDSARLMILDARSKGAWNQTHIPGAIPVPYYEEPEKFVKNIPNDSTWIVVYCACPHAASGTVVNTLRRYNYKNTAVLDEGILIWAQRGYPVQYGQDAKTKK